MLSSLGTLLRYHELAIKEISGRATRRVRAEKARCDQELSPQLMGRYQYLFSRYRASAVTPLRSGCCSGCYVHVAKSKHNKVDEGVYVCEQCGRLLFDADESKNW